MDEKLVKLSVVRDAMDAHFRGEITYTKAVEIINEEADKELKLESVTRIEVIDHNGRSYVNMNVKNHEFSYQDDNRTLKIFINKKDNNESNTNRNTLNPQF